MFKNIIKLYKFKGLNKKKQNNFGNVLSKMLPTLKMLVNIGFQKAYFLIFISLITKIKKTVFLKMFVIEQILAIKINLRQQNT